jgi:tripeptidyl-peptidase-1
VAFGRCVCLLSCRRVIALIPAHADDITAHLKPLQESIAAFNAFARINGLNATTAGGHGEWMSFTTNVSHANSLFAASFQQFQHVSTAAPIIRTLSYSLPRVLVDHVDTVYPMTTFGTPLARRNTSPATGVFAKRHQTTSFNITPSVLQKLYNIPPVAKNPAGTSILITGYLDEVPQTLDTAVSTDDALDDTCSWASCSRHSSRCFDPTSIQRHLLI